MKKLALLTVVLALAACGGEPMTTRGHSGGGATAKVVDTNGLVDGNGDVILNEDEVLEQPGGPIELPETATQPAPAAPGGPATEGGFEQPPM